MDKSDKIFNALKTIGIIAVIALIIWWWDSRSQNQYRHRDEIWTKLSGLAEDVREISNAAYDAYNYYEGEESLRDELSDIYWKCDKLGQELEYLAGEFADRD